MLTALQHVAAIREEPAAMKALIADREANPSLVTEARDLLAHYQQLRDAGRLDSCWVSRTAQETLTAALAAANV